MKDLFLLRGLPNSGKSTIASFLAPSATFAADDFFETKASNEGITYEEAFKKYSHLIAVAHKNCQECCEFAMVEGYSTIAIANTFTTMKELKPYLDLAQRYDYRVHCLTIERLHEGDNNHHVPDEVIVKMAKRWQFADKRMS